MAEEENDNLESILDKILDATDGEEHAGVNDLLEAFGSRSFGPLLVAPAVLMISPIGAIPLAPVIFNIFIILICVQYIAGMSIPWLPRMLRRQSISRDRLESVIKRVHPWAERVDILLKPRLDVLTRPPVDRALAAVATVLSSSIFLIGFVPFAAAVPSTGIALIGLAVATRDGLVALLALTLVAGTVWLAISLTG